MNRPAAWAVAAFAVGLYLAATLKFAGPGLAFALVAAGTAAAWFGRRWAASQPLFLLLVFCGIGVMWWTARHAAPPGDPLGRFAVGADGTVYALEGRVRRADLVLPGTDYASFIVDVDTAATRQGGAPVEGGMYVRWTRPSMQLHPGDRVRVRGVLEPALGPVNHGVYGVEDALRRQGVHTAVRVRGPTPVEKLSSGPWWRPTQWAGRFRAQQAQVFARAVPESALPFVLAVWLGERSGITQAQYDTFVETGAAHILAVSGLHMAIVFASGAFLLRLAAPRRRRLRAVLTMLLVAGFALTAGARLSSLRAAFMICLYLAADLVGRERDAITALALAAALFLGVNPALLFAPAFLLSFLSVASILLFSDAISDALARVPHGLRGGLATAISVQLLPLPVAIHQFHVLPLLATLVNLLVVPLLAAALWLCFMVSVSGLFPGDLALVFGHATWLTVSAIGAVCSLAARFGAYLTLSSPTSAGAALYWAAILAAFHWRGAWQWLGPAVLPIGRSVVPGPSLVTLLGRASGPTDADGAKAFTLSRAFALAPAAALLLAAAVLWHPLSTEPFVAFLDVGQGDATIIRTRSGAALLVDGGDRSEYTDQGRRVVAPFARSHGIRRIDFAAVTHSDRDHMGGVISVIEQMPVGTVLLSAVPSGRALEDELLLVCARRGIPVRRIAVGNTLELEGARVEVLHPPAGWPRHSPQNDASLVLRVAWEGLSLLLPGDIEYNGERQAAEAGCRADVLKVPHHGSATSSSALFLDTVTPQSAVISAGPSADRVIVNEAVVNQYRARGIEVWRTDHHGGVMLTVGSGGPTFSSARETKGYLHRGGPWAASAAKRPF